MLKSNTYSQKRKQNDIMSKINNRRFERYDTTQKVSYRTSPDTAYKHGITNNISKTGMLLETQEPVAQGTPLDLVLKIKGTPVHFKGKCVYTLGENHGAHSGVHIGKINTAGMKLFLAFISALEKANQAPKSSLRPEIEEMENVLLKISGEHKVITHFVVGLQDMMKDHDPSAEPAEYEAILNLMKKDLTTHFEIEEKIYFKIGLTHMPAEHHGLITELTNEHEDMREKLDRIIDFIEECSRTNAPVNKNLKALLTELLEQIKEHARKEITDLFPFMEENGDVKSKLMETLRMVMS